MIADAPPAQSRTSASIGIARVICILGVVYVHAWTGLTGPKLAAADHTPQGMLRWVLMELLGRSAVPLLGMISGWLVSGTVRNRSYRRFLAGKMRTILLPMVLWNGLAVLLVSGAASLGVLSAPTPTSWGWIQNELFCLTGPANINVQMYFLRDLWVCMALAPALVRAPGWALGAVIAAALAWAVSGIAFPLLLRPEVLVFFASGVAARRAGMEKRVAGWPLLATALPYVGLALINAWLGATGASAAKPWALELLNLSMRFAAALFFWSLAWRLSASKAAAPLLRIEPYVFLMFCAHLIIIWLGGPLVGWLTGPLGSPFYPLFLLSQPALVLLAALGVGRLLIRYAPSASRVLSGGRLRAEVGYDDRRRVADLTAPS